jgi:ribosome-associated toxin RatA of RatAB toxin-antitoxin module
MRFAFKSTLSAMLFEQKFADTAGSLVEAFVVRSRTTSPPPAAQQGPADA